MADNIDNEINNTNRLPDAEILNENMNQEINNEFEIDQERLNDEGYEINSGFDYENGYRVLFRLGVPPTLSGSGMGVGEYSGNFYSKMMNQAKIREEEGRFKDDEKEIKYDLENGDKNMIGYISNEIYYPIEKDKKVSEKEIDSYENNGLMDASIGELLQNTSLKLDSFDSDFLKTLHRVDIEFGYTNTNNGTITNIKRYLMAFMMYLQEEDNILYMGITLFIISIILYFINIIRKND